MEQDLLKLDRQLCFPLYACARDVVKRYTPFLNELGLTYTQYIALMALWERKSMTVKELGETLYLDSGTLTPLLKRMEQEELVVRQRSAADERSVIVSITDKGEGLKEKCSHIPLEVAKCFRLTEEEAVTLYRLLYRILGQDDKG